MSANHSQPGHSALELFLETEENQFNIDQLLSVQIVTTRQSSSSTQFNPTNMIANIEANNIELTRQHAREGPQQDEQRRLRQQQQQEQRRLRQEQQQAQRRLRQEQQQEQRRLRQGRQQEHREPNHRHRERRERRYQQRIERINQWETDRDQSAQEEADHEAYLLQRSPTFDELMDEILDERQLDAYYLETMTPQERQEIWEQQHLNELQGNPAPRVYGLPLNDLEGYAQFLQRQRWWDEHEQTMRVYDLQNSDYTQECTRNEELLMQKEDWEETAFRLQQLQ